MPLTNFEAFYYQLVLFVSDKKCLNYCRLFFFFPLFSKPFSFSKFVLFQVIINFFSLLKASVIMLHAKYWCQTGMMLPTKYCLKHGYCQAPIRKNPGICLTSVLLPG